MKTYIISMLAIANILTGAIIYDEVDKTNATSTQEKQTEPLKEGYLFFSLTQNYAWVKTLENNLRRDGDLSRNCVIKSVHLEGFNNVITGLPTQTEGCSEGEIFTYKFMISFILRHKYEKQQVNISTL
jgi:hypothetical protein